MKKIVYILFCSAMCIMYVSCDLPVNAGYDSFYSDSANETISKIDELFLPSCDNSENSVQYTKKIFETNNTLYLCENGYTIWTSDKINSGSGFEPISVCIKKMYGNPYTGFGIVFNCTEDNGNVKMLSVMINSNSQYIIGKVSGGKFEPIVPWTTDAHIVSALGNENKLNIDFDSAENKYVLKINGSEIKRFSDIDFSILDFTGFKSGYVVVISPDEDFVNSSVRVEFKR